jgi:hydroxyacylglutathione hydrolase
MNKPDHTKETTRTTDEEKPERHLLAPHVWQLKRSPSNLFNVYLIEDVLIDTATRWDGPSLLKQLATTSLSQVALTHCHPDHQGAVKQICESRGIPLACHEADVASMEGRVPMQPRNVATQLIELAFAGLLNATRKRGWTFYRRNEQALQNCLQRLQSSLLKEIP